MSKQKHYCLAIEVESPHIDNGLGYMIAFTLPTTGMPGEFAGFAAWCDSLREVVARAGDRPFSPDSYTRRVAIAELMNDIETLNSRHAINIGGEAGMPTVQIQSTNPYDRRINVDFTDSEGHFHVREETVQGRPYAQIGAAGRIVVMESPVTDFPFAKTAVTPPAPPAAPQKPPARSAPQA